MPTSSTSQSNRYRYSSKAVVTGHVSFEEEVALISI
jgi:hypothetical protein